MAKLKFETTANLKPIDDLLTRIKELEQHIASLKKEMRSINAADPKIDPPAQRPEGVERGNKQPGSGNQPDQAGSVGQTTRAGTGCGSGERIHRLAAAGL